MSCISGTLGPMTSDKHLGVILTNRQPIVLARLSEDPDRPPDPAPKYPLGQCERPEWPFPSGDPQPGNVLHARSGTVHFCS